MLRLFTTLFSIGFGICCQAAAYTLSDLQRAALEHNRTLQNARIDIEMANADKAQAFTNYFPQISVNATGFLGAKDLIRTSMDMSGLSQSMSQMLMGTVFGQHLLAEGFGDIAQNMPTSNDVSMVKKGVMVNAMVMQPIFQGGQIVNGNRLAALQQEVRRLQYALSEKDLMQNVAEYYWQLSALQGNITTLDATDEALTAIHTLTENYVKAGVINRNDLLTVELKQQEMASARLQLDNGMSVLRYVLAQLCGLDADAMELTFPPLSEADVRPDEVFVSPDEAVLNRIELALADRNVAAKRLQVKMEVGKHLPSLAVGAAALYQGIDMGDMSVSRGGNMQDMKSGNIVGLATMSIPVSEWWGGSHAIRKARLARQQAENDRLEAEEKLRIDILTAWNNLTEGYAQIAIAQKSVASSTENLRLNRDQYAAGTLPMSDLLNAVTLYTKANSELHTAISTYQTRLSDYLRKTH